MTNAGLNKYPMSDFKKIILPENEIKETVSHMAKQISEHYAGRKLLVCGILKGAFIFVADLVREMEIPAELAFIKASSYGGGAFSSGDVKLAEFFVPEPRGDFDILIADDILDTGNTFRRLKEQFNAGGFASVEFCALLDKPERRECEISARYIGKKIANEFVVGYGLDYGEKYRDLPFVAVLSEKALENNNLN
ncbi:MAG: hypoxanthine phosphoribosyltransferase [Oscillospiraceae bacterium]|jgi:hypoxanthine phosphoribosyltransferase|nr:hypoxanthine phosphoribosyltransferase [Oscillospiraceae bacterium]